MKNKVIILSIISLVSSTTFSMGWFRQQQGYTPISTSDEPTSYHNALKNMMLYDIEDPQQKEFLKAIERGDVRVVDEYLSDKSFIQTAPKNLFLAAKAVAAAKKNAVMINKLSKIK